MASAQSAVEVQLSSYKFTPNDIHLHAGERVVLHLVNTSNTRHTFDAPEFFAAASAVSGPVHDGEVELAAHETAEVTLTPERGSYHLHCDRPFHQMFGMHGQIMVE